MLHAAIALCIQALVAALSADWWLGAVAGAGYFVGREYAQAEYRVIAALYGGKREAMPWWGGVDPRAWTTKGLLDFMLPAVAVCAVAIIFQGG